MKHHHSYSCKVKQRCDRRTEPNQNFTPSSYCADHAFFIFPTMARSSMVTTASFLVTKPEDYTHSPSLRSNSAIRSPSSSTAAMCPSEGPRSRSDHMLELFWRIIRKFITSGLIFFKEISQECRTPESELLEAEQSGGRSYISPSIYTRHEVWVLSP